MITSPHRRLVIAANTVRVISTSKNWCVTNYMYTSLLYCEINDPPIPNDHKAVSQLWDCRNNGTLHQRITKWPYYQFSNHCVTTLPLSNCRGNGTLHQYIAEWVCYQFLNHCVTELLLCNCRRNGTLHQYIAKWVCYQFLNHCVTALPLC